MSKNKSTQQTIDDRKGKSFCLHTRELLLNLIWNATQRNNWNRWFSSFILSRISILFALLMASFVVTSFYSFSSSCPYSTPQYLHWYFHFPFEAQRYVFSFSVDFLCFFYIGWHMLLCQSIFEFIFVNVKLTANVTWTSNKYYFRLNWRWTMCFSVDPKRFVAECVKSHRVKPTKIEMINTRPAPHVFIHIKNIFVSLDYRACPFGMEFFFHFCCPVQWYVWIFV